MSCCGQLKNHPVLSASLAVLPIFSVMCRLMRQMTIQSACRELGEKSCWGHTSYLSRARGEKNCHVEKFVHMTYCHVEKNSPHEKCEENLKCGEIMCTMYSVLLNFTIFCCKISCLRFTLFCREISLGTIYALLRGEKISQKLCPWRKSDK